MKWKFNIYDFPSVASAMWVRMCGVKCIKARFKRIWFQGLALIRDSWFLDKSRNLIVCVSVDPVDSVEIDWSEFFGAEYWLDLDTPSGCVNGSRLI